MARIKLREDAFLPGGKTRIEGRLVSFPAGEEYGVVEGAEEVRDPLLVAQALKLDQFFVVERPEDVDELPPEPEVLKALDEEHPRVRARILRRPGVTLEDTRLANVPILFDGQGVARGPGGEEIFEDWEVVDKARKLPDWFLVEDLPMEPVEGAVEGEILSMEGPPSDGVQVGGFASSEELQERGPSADVQPLPLVEEEPSPGEGDGDRQSEGVEPPKPQGRKAGRGRGSGRAGRGR